MIVIEARHDNQTSEVIAPFMVSSAALWRQAVVMVGMQVLDEPDSDPKTG